MSKLLVYFNGERAGVLEDGDSPVFTYDAEWLPRAFPLSRQLPLQAEPFSGRPVRAFFSGLLPEADPRARIASILGISVSNEFAMLERIGGECAGAVGLIPDGTPEPSWSVGGIRWLDGLELEKIIEELPKRPLLAGEAGLRLSLAGAQAKLPIILSEDSPEAKAGLPLGGSPSTHIVKPEPERFPGLAANEAYCMELARRIGLQVADSRWQMIGKTPCLVVKRYDRTILNSGAVARIHQEDFCQALGYPPERKYQQEGGPSLRDCFSLLREWSSAPVLDIPNFLDGVTFGVLIGNADAHAKKFSILYGVNGRRLAPLYDQVCTLAWPELSKSLSMKIGTAKILPEVSPEHFRQLSTEARLSWPMVRHRLADLCEKMRSAIESMGSLPSHPPQSDISRARELILQRVERGLRLLKVI